MVPKVHTGPGTGNQSDDEMAFMGFYNLLNYEHDLELRALWARAFFRYWRMEEPERNPLFNFLYAATYREDTVYSDAFGPAPLAPTEGWLEDSIDTLKLIPTCSRWRNASFTPSIRTMNIRINTLAVFVQLSPTGLWSRNTKHIFAAACGSHCSEQS